MKIIPNLQVSKEEWSGDYYPTYCSGSAFILTPDVAMVLHEVSYHVPFFWVDDFYITGLLPLKAGNIVHRQFNSAYVLDGTKLEEYFTGPQWHIYVFSHLKDLNKILRVWNKLTKLAKREIMPQINKVLPGQLKSWWSVQKVFFFVFFCFKKICCCCDEINTRDCTIFSMVQCTYWVFFLCKYESR